MTKLQAYTDELLTEKVSKKEIDTALKKKNILIGCEFEWISYEMDELTNDVSEYDDAYKAWRDYKKALVDFGKEYSHQQEIMGKADDEADRLENEDLSDVEDALDDAEDIEIQTTRKRKIKELKKKKQDIKDAITLQREKFEEAEGEQDTMDIDYVNLEPYKEYMDTYHGGHDVESFDHVIFALEYWDWKTDENFLPEPEEFSYTNRPQARMEQIDWDDAPFANDFDIGEYGEVSQKVGSSTWAMEPDETLGENGVEVKSPPTPLPEALNDIEDMFNWIESGRGETDNRCGFHVHMSIKGVSDLEKVIDPVKIILFMDEGYMWKAFPGRKDSSYIWSIKDRLKSAGDVVKIDWSKVIDTNKAKAKIFTDHYDAISFRDMSDGHVEFRYLGGKNYSKRFNDVKAAIGQFAHNLSLACDEDYKKKEYFHKLQRIFNKIEVIKLRWERDLIKLVLEEKKNKLYGKQEIILTKRLKEINNKLSNLPYKIDAKTLTSIFKNHGFMDNVKKELLFNTNKLIRNDVVDDVLLQRAVTRSITG